MNNELLKIINVNRDAIATNRGFYFQYLCLLKRWVDNFISGTEKLVFTEVGDDIKEVGEKMVFTQIKCYSKTFNLKADEVKKALYNFFFLYLQEKEEVPELGFVFETNASIAPNEKLLKRWIDNSGQLSGELRTLAIGKVKEILLERLKKERNSRLQSERMPDDKKQTLKQAYAELESQISPQNLNDFIDRLNWCFGGESPEAAIQTTYAHIRAALRHEKFKDQPAETLLDVLLSEIYRCSQLKNSADRYVDSNKLVQILARKAGELEPYINKKLTELLGNRLIAMEFAIADLQKDQIKMGHHVEGLRREIDQKIINRELPRYITPAPSVYADTVFGRDEDISTITELINLKRHLAIAGTGGMGKTTLAKAFLSKNETSYDHIIWIDAQEDLVSLFVTDPNFELYFPPESNEQEPAVKRFERILSSINAVSGNNLMVINDFKDDFESLGKLKKLKNWQILVTTRSLLTGVHSHKVKSLDFIAAVELYRNYEPDRAANEDQLNELFDSIGYNTLLIELVAKTIHNSVDLTVGSFIEYLKTQSLDDFDLEIEIITDDLQQTTKFFNVLQQTFSIAGLNNFDKTYLEFFALLPSEGTKITELVEWYGKDHEKQNKVQFPNLINKLVNTGWIDRDGDNIFMHKMLQESIIYAERKQLNSFIGSFPQFNWLARRLNEGINSDPAKALRFLKYGESILFAIKEPYRTAIYQPLLMIENEVLNVYNWMIVKHDTVAKWESLKSRAEAYLPDDSQLLGTIYNNYALAISIGNERENAIPYFKKAIEILSKGGMESAVSYLYALNNLARLYSEIDEFEKFRETFEKATKVRKKYDLFNDQSFAMQCNLMGIVNQNVGNHKVAITFFKMAVEAQYEVDADKRNDLNLVLFLNNLAFNLTRTGENDLALSIINKALTELTKLEVYNSSVFPMVISTLIYIMEESGETEQVEQMKSTLKDILENKKYDFGQD